MTEPSRQARIVAAVDVGGTKVAGALVSLPVEPERPPSLITRVELPAVAHDRPGQLPDQNAQVTRTVLDRLADQAGERDLRIETIGVGVPEYVTPDGRIISREVLGWPDPLDLGDLVPETLGVHADGTGLGPAGVRFESDVRSSARAEWQWGLGRHSGPAAPSSMLYVSLGTGLSHCLVVDGHPVHGFEGRAIALGELRIPGSAHNLEQLCSGRGLADRWRDRGGDQRSGSAHHRPIDARQLLNIIGNDKVDRFVDDAAMMLGWGLAQAAAVTAPEIIVIGGGLGTGSARYRDLVAEHFATAAVRPVPITAATTGTDSGLLGVALAAAEAMPQ